MAHQHFVQRVSVAVLRGNAASVLGCALVRGEGRGEVWGGHRSVGGLWYYLFVCEFVCFIVFLPVVCLNVCVSLMMYHTHLILLH